MQIRKLLPVTSTSAPAKHICHSMTPGLMTNTVPGAGQRKTAGEMTRSVDEPSLVMGRKLPSRHHLPHTALLHFCCSIILCLKVQGTCGLQTSLGLACGHQSRREAVTRTLLCRSVDVGKRNMRQEPVVSAAERVPLGQPVTCIWQKPRMHLETPGLLPGDFSQPFFQRAVSHVFSTGMF